MNDIIQVTPSAAAHIRKQLEQRGRGIGIRIGVKTSGCSGLSYLLEFVDQANEQDRCFNIQDISFYIAPESLIYLRGTELDFATEGLNSGIKFNNPNAVSTCGCGESFTVQT